MKIGKATETLEELPDTPNNDPSPTQRDAIKLGAEALKRTQAARVSQTCLCNQPLPGETPEGD